jgi:CheY-like chemotaxis protein
VSEHKQGEREGAHERTRCDETAHAAHERAETGAIARDDAGRGVANAPAVSTTRRSEMFGTYPARNASGVAHDEGRAAEARETILLVEDEPAVRQLFAQALVRAGYRVFEARNGQEAIKVFDEHGDGIDLLLTDMRMPYMGGGELAQQLRARRLTLKLICISGYPGTIDPELASDFLAKPFSRDDLLKKVREVLDRR